MTFLMSCSPGTFGTTRETIADRNCPEFTREGAIDFASLGERAATRDMRRVICYCWPERCREAALRKLKANFPDEGSGTDAAPVSGDPGGSE